MRMKSLAVMVSLICAISLLSISCGLSSKTVTIKAAIVYKMGGAQPVARVPFYLLNESLEAILDRADLIQKWGETRDTATGSYYSAMAYQGEKRAKMEEALLPHIVKTITTDFEGNGKFDSVESGTYYLVGIAQTRSGFAVWSLKLDVDGNKTILLDQNNAAEIH